MAILTLTKIDPADLDESDTYYVPDYINKIGSALLLYFFQKNAEKEKITVVINHDLESISSRAFFDVGKIKEIEVRITENVRQIKSDAFCGVSELMIPSLTKAYRAKSVFTTIIGRCIRLTISDIGETYTLLTYSHHNNSAKKSVMVVKEERTMEDGILYEGFVYEGSVKPKSPQTVYAFIVKSLAVKTPYTCFAHSNFFELQRDLLAEGIK